MSFHVFSKNEIASSSHSAGFFAVTMKRLSFFNAAARDMAITSLGQQYLQIFF